MERVLIPVLIMTGAGVLVALAVPVAFLMISGGYFARRTAIRYRRNASARLPCLSATSASTR